MLLIFVYLHLRPNSKAEEFSKLLLNIGNGTISEVVGKINIPKNLGTVVKVRNSLINRIYPDIHQHANNSDSVWLREIAILTPKE